MPAWKEFQQQRGRQAPPSDDEYDALCARLLITTDGKLLLAALRSRFMDGHENPAGPEANLRVRVTQQQFIRDLENARDRGLEAAQRRAEADKPKP